MSIEGISVASNHFMMFELKDEERLLREYSASELYVIQKQLKQKVDDFLRGLDG